MNVLWIIGVSFLLLALLPLFYRSWRRYRQRRVVRHRLQRLADNNAIPEKNREKGTEMASEKITARLVITAPGGSGKTLIIESFEQTLRQLNFQPKRTYFDPDSPGLGDGLRKETVVWEMDRFPNNKDS